MQVEPLAIDGAWVLTPRQHADDRGVFLEWFQAPVIEQTVGFPLTIAQANQSVSRRGTLRGIHYADVPPSQAKYVHCSGGAVLDVVVDIRVGSPTYGEHAAVLLDAVDRRAVYLSEGLGHAFVALQDGTTVTYLVSTPYSPIREHGMHPLDSDLALPWPVDLDIQLSDKDAAAPGFAEAAAAGALPTYADCLAFAAKRRQAAASR